MIKFRCKVTKKRDKPLRTLSQWLVLMSQKICGKLSLSPNGNKYQSFTVTFFPL